MAAVGDTLDSVTSKAVCKSQCLLSRVNKHLRVGPHQVWSNMY
jgi:hypothetical protein